MVVGCRVVLGFWWLLVVDTRPKTENLRAFIRPPDVATLPHVQGPLEGPLDDCVWCGTRGASGALSFSGGRYLSTFGGVAGILDKFLVITKGK